MCMNLYICKSAFRGRKFQNDHSQATSLVWTCSFTAFIFFQSDCNNGKKEFFQIVPIAWSHSKVYPYISPKIAVQILQCLQTFKQLRLNINERASLFCNLKMATYALKLYIPSLQNIAYFFLWYATFFWNATFTKENMWNRGTWLLLKLPCQDVCYYQESHVITTRIFYVRKKLSSI